MSHDTEQLSQMREALGDALPPWLLTAPEVAVDLAHPGTVTVQRPDGRRFVLQYGVLELLRSLVGRSADELDATLAACGLMADDQTYRRLGELAGSLTDRTPRLDAPGFLVRWDVIPAGPARWVGRRLSGLFRVPVAVVGLLALVGLDLWLATRLDLHDVGWGLAWVSVPLLLLAAAFHEVGHASALVRADARPGAIGAGIYLVWPVFFADITESWFLTRRQRMLVDAGGVYFQLLAALALVSAGLASGWRELQIAGVLVQLATTVNFNPLFRYDGHWLLADWLGVPDLYRAGRRAWRPGPSSASPRDRWILRCFWALVLVFWPLVLGLAVVTLLWQTVGLAGTGRLDGVSVGWPPDRHLGSYLVNLAVLALAAYQVARLVLDRRRHRRDDADARLGLPTTRPHPEAAA